jgi:ligand-binding sensor domain-containing protein/signal transduction histidine kinase
MRHIPCPLAYGACAAFAVPLLWAFSAQVQAQVPRPLRPPAEFALDQWTTEHGLPQNSVNALALGPDGYLWIGTFGGLARFDGTRFTPVERTDESGRHIDRILALASAPDSALWIGTETGLLRRKHQRYQVFTRRNGLPDDEVRALFVDGTGVVWIGTGAGGLSWLKHGLLHTVQQVAGRRVAEVSRITGAADGTIWINTAAGVLRVPRGDARAIQWHAAAGSGTSYLQDDADGSIWFGQNGRTLRRAANGIVHTVPVAGSIMVGDSESGYWVGTINDGAFFLRPDADGMAAQQYPLPEGRKGYRVRSMLVDQDGSVWLGTNASGLLRARRNLFTSYTSAHGLSHDVVTAVFADRRGTVWVATNCGGVNAIDPARSVVRHFNPRSPQDPNGDPCVFALAEDQAGVWQGSYGGGVTALPTQPGTPRRKVGGLPDHEVLALFTDRAGVMWVGMRSSGLARVQDGRVRALYTVAHGLAHNSVRVIQQTRDGALWIGTLEGLSRFQQGRFTSFTAAHGLSAGHVRAIYEDAEGTLWIGTYGGGLNRLRNGALVAITQQDGLGDDVVSSILEDDHGNFWMSGNRGIYRAAREQLNAFADGRIPRVHSVLYGREDGLLNPETNGGFQPAASRDARGHFWFPTVEGVAVVDPSRIQRARRAPTVALEEIVVDGVPQKATARIEVGPQRPNIEFRYAGLRLSAPEHLRFRYRLDGFDDAWVEAGTRNVAYYPRLPAGQYRFLVHAANRDGEWSEQGAALDLRVAPAAWNTWWFRVTTTLLALLLVFAWHRRRTMQAAAQHAAQQEFSRQLMASQELERRRLASELHDGLGQELLIARNRVLLALRADGTDPRVREQLNHIADLVTSSLASIRELAHNLTPHQLEHLGITSALKTMIEGVADASGIEIDLLVDEIDGLMPLDSEINFYRIMQEALSNVVHHAQTRTALVHVRRQGNEVRASVVDYGRGFRAPRDQRELRAASFGLSSMAERARIMGGTLTIESDPDSGTRVELGVPVLSEPMRRATPAKAPEVKV